ncbi:hypothetical protein N7520_009892 [Penicillium odoratum]|uniref:uncharacterized protein n=1 Tax=Penicillium odoratum TaxID=1167516 RepID=UPI002547BDA6|nr:uncharacterized protein N7520_009892 [Penicillium odoratum]KAJ5752975.1 hypothetical protein N7520_009892 [Penicillium odoratum]
MRFSLWATVFLGSDIVSSTLVSIARETYLPYFPSVGLESVANSYLYLNWAVVNGSLFANDDCVFPPLRPMRLHAPRRDDPANIPSKEDIVELSYALEAQPLPDKNGSVPTFIRSQFRHKMRDVPILTGRGAWISGHQSSMVVIGTAFSCD